MDSARSTLRERFRPVFARIAEQAVRRERERELAHDAIAWLREAGFGALRVPVHYGGAGASIEELFDLLIELAEADSNLPQILRSHFGFIERVRSEFTAPGLDKWLWLAGRGVIFGNATTELAPTELGTLGTRLRPTPQGLSLSGDKYYSTGTLYADWITVTAQREGDEAGRVIALVPADADGVQRIDDWGGFGQRLTASGTTRFRDVAVDPANVIPYERPPLTTMTAFLQLEHLASLAGIARAIARDAVRFVQARKRGYSHASGATPSADPLVQQVIGQLHSAAFMASAAVREVARDFDDIDRERQAGRPVPTERIVELELQTAMAQAGISDVVLAAATRLFDVGGASALQEDVRLDRHWRNARTLASHNPSIYKLRAVGDHALNGALPTFYWSVGTPTEA